MGQKDRQVESDRHYYFMCSRRLCLICYFCIIIIAFPKLVNQNDRAKLFLCTQKESTEEYYRCFNICKTIYFKVSVAQCQMFQFATSHKVSIRVASQQAKANALAIVSNWGTVTFNAAPLLSDTKVNCLFCIHFRYM